MKMTQFRQMIREIIDEELQLFEKQSQAAKDAKAQGLKWMGFGRWGKDGVVTHITGKSGNLEKYNKAAVARKTGLRFGRGSYADTLHTPTKKVQEPDGSTMFVGGRPKARMIEPGRIQSFHQNDPEQSRRINEPEDSLAGDYEGEPLADKLSRKIVDKLYSGNMDLVPGKSYSGEEVRKATGITSKQMRVYNKLNRGNYESAFSYDTESDTVHIHDLSDL